MPALPDSIIHFLGPDDFVTVAVVQHDNKLQVVRKGAPTRPPPTADSVAFASEIFRMYTEAGFVPKSIAWGPGDGQPSAALYMPCISVPELPEHVHVLKKLAEEAVWSTVRTMCVVESVLESSRVLTSSSSISSSNEVCLKPAWTWLMRH